MKYLSFFAFALLFCAQTTVNAQNDFHQSCGCLILNGKPHDVGPASNAMDGADVALYGLIGPDSVRVTLRPASADGGELLVWKRYNANTFDLPVMGSYMLSRGTAMLGDTGTEVPVRFLPGPCFKVSMRIGDAVSGPTEQFNTFPIYNGSTVAYKGEFENAVTITIGGWPFDPFHPVPTGKNHVKIEQWHETMFEGEVIFKDGTSMVEINGKQTKLSFQLVSRF
jgi:hypothetical protein